MIIQPIKQISASLFLSLFVVLSACAENPQPCEVGSLLQLSSADLGGYQKIETTLLGESAEGASVEYYYLANALKAIKSIYYGETGKTELEYYFYSLSTYTSKLTDYYYSVPIYIDHSEIVAIKQSNFTVCRGELVRGIGDDAIVNDFNRANNALKKARENAPKK